MPKLTIITICYNIANQIERTLKSIENQTFQDFEWIVVDGASSDGTKEIIERYKENIDFFISEKDSGIYNAMNKGIKNSHGQFLLFLNGGDQLSNNNIIETIQKYIDNKLDIIAFNENNICNNPNDSYVWIPSDTKVDFFITTLPHQATLINKRLFDKYGLYNENYKIVSDYEFFIRISKHNYKYKHINITLSNFYRDGISANISELSLKENNKMKKMYYPLRFFLNSHPKLIELRNCILHPRYFLGKIKKYIKGISKTKN